MLTIREVQPGWFLARALFLALDSCVITWPLLCANAYNEGGGVV